jgi:hypothetical protein
MLTMDYFLFCACCDLQNCVEVARSLAWVPLHIRLDIDEKYCSHCVVAPQHTDTTTMLKSRPGGFDEDVDALLHTQVPQQAVAAVTVASAASESTSAAPAAAAAAADNTATEDLEDWLDSVLQ